jgi:hypothetical protein
MGNGKDVCKEAVVEYLNALSKDLPGGTEERLFLSRI